MSEYYACWWHTTMTIAHSASPSRESPYVTMSRSVCIAALLAATQRRLHAKGLSYALALSMVCMRHTLAFTSACCEPIIAHLSPHHICRLRQAFHAFNSSRTGLMTASELFSALRWLEIQVEVPVVHDLLRRLDSDDDGRLSPEVSPISLHDRPYSFTETVHEHERR